MNEYVSILIGLLVLFNSAGIALAANNAEAIPGSEAITVVEELDNPAMGNPDDSIADLTGIPNVKIPLPKILSSLQNQHPRLEELENIQTKIRWKSHPNTNIYELRQQILKHLGGTTADIESAFYLAADFIEEQMDQVEQLQDYLE